MSVLFLTKTTEWCRIAERFITTHFTDVLVASGEWGHPLPEAVRQWEGEHVLSFVSPWIVPDAILKRATGASLNFHPGPPSYPGIGCYNFALYDEVAEYGVTCHHMAAKVDTGAIVRVKRFPVLPADTVATLKDRSMNAMLELLFEIVVKLSKGEALPASEETWIRAPFTRRELNELGRVTPEMTTQEIRRRYRAMHFPPYPGIFMDLAGITFKA